MAADFAASAGDVATALLGEPNRHHSTKEELRFGANGSLRVSIAGPHVGTWRDHEADTGGGVLDLIAHKRGGDRAAALAWWREHFEAHAPSKRQVAVYRYEDSAGELVHEVVRFDPKEFRQRRPDGKGGHIWNMQGVSPTLYNLPSVANAAARGELVVVVEGEKDADRLNALGFVATCNAGGAGKWKAEHSEQLAGARVVILPDNDDAGQAHAEAVAAALSGCVPEPKLLALDVSERKADVSDWLAAGGTAEGLRAAIEAAPAWRPSFKPLLPTIWFGQEDSAAPMRWLVRGMLVEGGLSALYGPPKSGKTFAALDLALHIAHGRDWYGLRVRPVGVVYISGEGAQGVRLRMKAWRQVRGGNAGAPFAMVPQSVNLFDGDEGVDRLISYLKAMGQQMHQPVGLVVLDTLSRMIGSGDEDRAQSVNLIVSRAERIQRETGAHVMIVHHSGKDKDRGMRGSNALLGAVDTAVEVSKDSGSGLYSAKVVAIKDGGEIGPFAYTLSQSAVGIDEDGETIFSCVLDPAGASQGARKDHLSDPERRCLAVLQRLFRDGRDMLGQSQGVPLGTWRDTFRDSEGGEVEARKKRAQRATTSLIDKGYVEVRYDQVWPAEAGE
jgi:5S rRNA maturation endonuclease (ribonuclease M5)